MAVLDSGVAFEDRGRFRRAPDLAGTRFVAGWDFVDDDPHPNDVSPRSGRRSHGTQMAGIIAQTSGNALGGAGVAPAAAIMPVRILTPDLNGTAKDIAQGVRFAVDHGADVINLSVAGPSRVRAVTKAVDYAAAKGVTVVAASGNGGQPAVGWPAGDPSVIAVGAVTRRLQRASYSNYGKGLDIVAPAGAGELLDTGYGPGDGVVAQTLKGGPSSFCFCFTASTSAAAAEVSGVAALLAGSMRRRSPARLRAALLSSARDLGARGRDPQYGAGLVQAKRALTVDDPVASHRGGDSDPSRGAWLTLALVCAALAGLAALLLAARRRRGRPV